jgi:hypothetical protein
MQIHVIMEFSIQKCLELKHVMVIQYGGLNLCLCVNKITVKLQYRIVVGLIHQRVSFNGCEYEHSFMF